MDLVLHSETKSNRYFLRNIPAHIASFALDAFVSLLSYDYICACLSLSLTSSESEGSNHV